MSPYVLVVDDDRSNSDVLSLVLQSEGYRVAVAANGAEALRVVESGRPDVIVLDLIMPKMDGWEFARRYRELPAPRAPIVVITAAAGRAVPGAEVCLAKPFDLEELLACLDRLTDGRGAARQPSLGEAVTT